MKQKGKKAGFAPLPVPCVGHRQEGKTPKKRLGGCKYEKRQLWLE